MSTTCQQSTAQTMEWCEYNQEWIHPQVYEDDLTISDQVEKRDWFCEEDLQDDEDEEEKYEDEEIELEDEDIHYERW